MDNLPELLRWGVALLAVASAVTDLRNRTIPNWLTLPMIGGALGMRFYLGGWLMLKAGLIGFAAGFAVYFLFFLLGGRGGGDVKLMGAYGALLGFMNWFALCILTAILGGVVALITVLLRGRLRQTVTNMRGLAGKNRVTLESKDALSLPHGAVAAVPALLIAWALSVTV